MNNIDIVKILKNCNRGTELYSPICGNVHFVEIINGCIRVKEEEFNKVYSFDKNGKYHNFKYSECLLFPSKEQRDWNKFKADVPIGTPVMALSLNNVWHLRYYDGNGSVRTGVLDNSTSLIYSAIVPVKDFDFTNPHNSLKYGIWL